MKKETHKCKKCKTTESNGWHGEQKRNWYGKKVMVWMCERCSRDEFISFVRSDPRLLMRYKGMYGKTPEEVLSN